jgi:hypothetical protein
VTRLLPYLLIVTGCSFDPMSRLETVDAGIDPIGDVDASVQSLACLDPAARLCIDFETT